jgi:protein MPE1
MSQMIVDSIPQLQAQIQQISLALQSSGTRSLPTHVRQQTEMQHQQLQMQLAHAQTIAAALAAAQSGMGAAEMMMPMGMMPLMNQGFAGPQMQIPPSQQQSQQQQQQQQQQQNQQQQQQLPGGADSAYQRQPVNSRRRNVKRERPSDFLEVGGPDADRDNKVARYWE